MREMEALAMALEYYLLDPQNMWFAPMIRITDGLTAQQAAWQSQGGYNSIWQIVHHLRSSHQMLNLALRGESNFQEKLGPDWQPVDFPSEREWKAEVAGLIDSCRTLAAALRMLPDSALEQPPAADWPTLRESLHGLLAHTGHHSAEAAMLRQMQGLRLAAP